MLPWRPPGYLRRVFKGLAWLVVELTGSQWRLWRPILNPLRPVKASPSPWGRALGTATRAPTRAGTGFWPRLKRGGVSSRSLSLGVTFILGFLAYRLAPATEVRHAR